ncbi:MAG: TIGR00341 family protein [Candidatus Nanosalina sp.]
MKQIQVNSPEDSTDEVEDVLQSYSSDVFSVEGERKEDKTIVFHATVESEDIDHIVDELKSIKDIELGDLVIRVFEEDSLIEKGQKTRGGSSMLSQEEVYSKAQGAASFNNAQWALTGLSAAIAGYGLMLDNIAVVIGAMMLAPLLSPMVSAAISLTVGDMKLLKQSFLNTGLAIPAAVLIAAASVIPFQVSINPTMNLIVSAGIENMILSLMVGAAAALAFVTGMRDQIAGVAVAIAVVPPLAAVGLGIKMLDLVFASRALSIALVNILAVLLSGSLSLKLLGFGPSTYYKKKSAERMRYVLPVSIAVMGAAMTFLILKPL